MLSSICKFGMVHVFTSGYLITNAKWTRTSATKSSNQLPTTCDECYAIKNGQFYFWYCDSNANFVSDFNINVTQLYLDQFEMYKVVSSWAALLGILNQRQNFDFRIFLIHTSRLIKIYFLQAICCRSLIKKYSVYLFYRSCFFKLMSFNLNQRHS